MVTVAGSSRVAILRLPGVPPVLPLCDNSGTTNQNSVSTWEKAMEIRPRKYIIKPNVIRYLINIFLIFMNRNINNQ